jgi:hypothetical protein
MALAEVDKAPFGWYHVRLAVVTGIGFFTDAYSVSMRHAETRMPLTTKQVVRDQPCSHLAGYSILAR